MSSPTAAAPTPAALPRLSVEEFMAQYADRPEFELVKGIVQEQPMSFPKHGKVCLKIGALIFNHAEANDLGHVMSNDSRVRVDGDSVRGGDVLFFSYERLPKGEVPEGLLPMPPDLVVEVRSPGDRWTRVMSKGIEYLEAGVRVVVVLDPETATASVYRNDELQQIYHNSDALTLPDVLPGFSVAVNRLFA